MMTLSFYVVQFFTNILMLLLLNQRTLKKIYYVSVTLFMVSIFITSWGIHFVMSDEMTNFVEKGKAKEFETLKLVVWVLIWLRLWQIIMFVAYLIFALCFIAAYVMIGGHESLRQDFQERSRHIKRVPGATKFLKKVSRKYNP